MDKRLRIEETTRGSIVVSVPDAVGEFFEVARVLVFLEPLKDGAFRMLVPDRVHHKGGDLMHIDGGIHKDLKSAITVALALYEGARAIRSGE